METEARFLNIIALKNMLLDPDFLLFSQQSQRLPWNKLIKFCEHLVDLNPVFEVLRGTYVCPLVYHYPAHVGGPILAS